MSMEIVMAGCVKEFEDRVVCDVFRTILKDMFKTARVEDRCCISAIRDLRANRTFIHDSKQRYWQIDVAETTESFALSLTRLYQDIDDEYDIRVLSDAVKFKIDVPKKMWADMFDWLHI